MANIEENATEVVVVMIENLPQAPKNKISTLTEFNELAADAYTTVLDAMIAKHPEARHASAGTAKTSDKHMR